MHDNNDFSIPAAHTPPLGRLYQGVRYEQGRWPLWRWDQNLRYIAKSLLHRPTPWTDEDRRHFQESAAYLASSRWRQEISAPVRLLAAGDLMWIRSGWEEACSAGVQRRIEQADAVFVNLETPMVPERPVPRLVYETLHYNAPPVYLEPWRAAPHGFVSLCNNHALDQGIEGLQRTREVVTGLGFDAVGGTSDGDCVAVREVAGIRITVVGLTFGINHLEGPPPAGIPVVRFGDPLEPPDRARLEALMQAARATRPDLIVAMPHWGYEYEYWPDALMRRHGLELVALGADLVFGTSPHVLQPVEVVSVNGADESCPSGIEGEGPARLALVVWSLGDFCSVIHTMACQVGALLEIDVGRTEDGRVVLGNVAAIPTVCGRGLGRTWLDGRVVTLEEYAESADASRHRSHVRRMLGPLVQGS